MNKNSIDLDFSYDGDFLEGNNGDLKDTSDDLIRSFVTEVRNIIRSSFGDWEKHPVLGTNISDFTGEMNTRETGKKIEQRVVSSLVTSGIVNSEDIFVKVTPVHVHQVLVIVNILAMPTPGNRLVVGQPVSISLIYDSSEDSIFFLPIKKSEREYLKG